MIGRIGLFFADVRIPLREASAERAMPEPEIVPVIAVLEMHNLVDVAATVTYLDLLHEQCLFHLDAVLQ